MVRNLLGNIKGPKGDMGPQGERGLQGPQGTLANESIGVVNKIDIAELDPRGTTATYNYDIDSGVVQYSGVTSFIAGNVTLNGVQHTVRVEDYLTNSGYYAGLLNFQVLDSDGTTVISERVSPKTNVSVDLTGRDRQEYQVLFRVTSSTPFSGFIEKPMLVEGDISVLWSYPEKQGAEYISALLRDEITGLQAEPSFATISGATTGSTQSVNSNNEIVLTAGVWVVSINAYLSPIDYDSYVNIGIYHNNSQIVLWQKGSQSSKDFSGNQIVRVNEGDRISVRAYKPSSGGTVSFGATGSNKINVYKIG